MKKLFEVKEVDRKCYEKQIRDFLPEKIIDIHTHVWKGRGLKRNTRLVSWPALVASKNPIEDLQETYRLMFPGKEVTPLLFSVAREGNVDRRNKYVQECALKHKLPALLFAIPQWSGEELVKRIRKGGFLGVKVYLSLAPAHIPRKEIRIFDFLPHHQLEVLNRLGLIVMLHIPRDGRLKDPVNLAQMLEIDEKYPRIKLIIAHVGRAYCPEDVGDAFEKLKKTKNMLFDISASTSQYAFEKAIKAVGPQRILFGSDMPILRMRMRRICEKGCYVNLVPKGLYGDVSNDIHMREVTGREADKLTFFMYEEIKAFKRAAKKCGLSQKDIEDVFYNNAYKIIEQARPQPVRPQLQMVLTRSMPIKVVLPAGYRLRAFRAGDEQGYIRLIKRSGLSTWNKAFLERILQGILPEGLFLIIHHRTGRIVASASAHHQPIKYHRFGGELGWVAVDQDHRGKKLGAVTCQAAIKRLKEAGYSDIYLRTDDWRLPAIKTYLNLGWVPFLFVPGMKKRWENVSKELGIDFKKLKTIKRST